MLEKVIDFLCSLLGKLPLECMEFDFMQMALLAILLIAPLTAVAGVQVVNYRMAFFADTIGHSAFAGAALGLILLGSNGPMWSMPILALLIGWGVMVLKRTSKLASDTSIGIFFAFIVSGGLLLSGSDHELTHMAQNFIFGDILLVDHQDIAILALLYVLYAVFTIISFNAMQLIAVDEVLARAHGVKTTLWSFLHISLLSLITILCVKAVGVLLISALLVVPAATARNLTTRAGNMVIYSAVIGLLCGAGGLLLSVQESINTASGAAIVMLNCLVFMLSLPIKYLRNKFEK